MPEKVVTVTNSNGSVTALDVLKAVSGSDTETKETLNGKTYHYQGVLSWYDSQYGNYIPAVKMENHANSDLGKYLQMMVQQIKQQTLLLTEEENISNYQILIQQKQKA